VKGLFLDEFSDILEYTNRYIFSINHDFLESDVIEIYESK